MKVRLSAWGRYWKRVTKQSDYLQLVKKFGSVERLRLYLASQIESASRVDSATFRSTPPEKLTREFRENAAELYAIRDSVDFPISINRRGGVS